MSCSRKCTNHGDTIGMQCLQWGGGQKEWLGDEAPQLGKEGSRGMARRGSAWKRHSQPGQARSDVKN